MGIEEVIGRLPFDSQIVYADLNVSGIARKRFDKYDFIIVLPLEIDDDIWLCDKLKLLIPDIPIIFAYPEIPSNYRRHLKRIGVEIVLDGDWDAAILSRHIDLHRQKTHVY